MSNNSYIFVYNDTHKSVTSSTDTMHLELWYQRIWGTFNITLGIIFSVVFVLGAFVLNDLTQLLYIILAAGSVYAGLNRLKRPYVVCSEDTPGKNGNIKVFSALNILLYNYRYESREEITVTGGRLYQNGKKLRFNSWFTNRHQWEKIVRYYRDGTLPADDLLDL